MTTPLPMPSDFAIRLAGGMAAMLLIAPWKVIPAAFFRTHCLVILALAVVAALVAGRGVPTPWLAGMIGVAGLAYLASALWGIGLPKLALPLTLGIALVSLSLLVAASWGGRPPLIALDASSRIASGVLMGSTLTAMLLGHHYLIAPAMSITPLRRFVGIMAVSLAVRSVLAAVGLGLVIAGRTGVSSGDAIGPLFLGMRWGMGIFGPALATVLTWKTVEIRSTQSATGILYIAMTLVLFGELSGLVLAQSAGVEV